MAPTAWRAPTVRALNEVANARYGQANWFDYNGYESSLPDLGA